MLFINNFKLKKYNFFKKKYNGISFNFFFGTYY